VNVLFTFGVDPFTKVYPMNKRVKEIKVLAKPMILSKGPE